jgi:hypothetical protein
VVDQPEPVFTGNALLQRLDLGRMKLDHLAGAQIDEMIMMFFRHSLVARAAIAEIMALDDADVLEQLDGAVDGGHGNPRIDQDSAAVQFLDIGMIIGAIEHAGDDATLLGHPHAALGAPVFQGFCSCGRPSPAPPVPVVRVVMPANLTAGPRYTQAG